MIERASSTRVAVPLLLALASAALFVGAPAASATRQPGMLFDDFSYRGYHPLLQLWQHGWKIRSEAGWPGVAGAKWPASGISFVADPARRTNTLLRLTSSTDGTAAGTRESQLCQQRKFFEGTYATRVRFEDAPDAGPDGDQLVETFYAISPLAAPLDPSYSELDWEYLPNGGWGTTSPTLFVTSWHTAQLDPFVADNTFSTTTGSLAGWHTLVFQVANGTVDYFLDGALIGSHNGRYYPRVPMSINYNLWFIQDGQLAPGGARVYHEDVDWVFHEVGAALGPQAVVAQVARLRRSHVAFRDTVPAESPPLNSPCNF